MDHPTTNVLLIEDNPGDADLVRFHHRRLHHDRAFGRRELDGIVDQVDEHFENAIGIGVNERKILVQSDFKSDLFFVGGWPQHGNRLLHQFSQRNAARLDAQLAAFGSGCFQKIADHGVQLIHALQHGLEVV